MVNFVREIYNKLRRDLKETVTVVYLKLLPTCGAQTLTCEHLRISAFNEYIGACAAPVFAFNLVSVLFRFLLSVAIMPFYEILHRFPN